MSIRQIIYNNVDPYVSQNFKLTKDEIFEGICKNLDNGNYFAAELNDFVVLFCPETQFVSKVHLFSENKTYSTLKNINLISKHYFDNTPCLKLYGLMSDRRIYVSSLRSGWKHQGIITKSFVLKNGDVVDQYITGITKTEMNELIEKRYNKWT
jgi:hypothetical protein